MDRAPALPAAAAPPTLSSLQGWVGALGSMVGASYQRVRRFASDHRKGLVCLAVTGGVVAYAVYRVGRGYRELQEASLHRLRLRGAFESTQSTCTATASSLVGKLNEAVVRLVLIPSPQDLRLSLQNAPKDDQNRYALWDHCKTQTFTRLVVSVYGVVLLSAFLRVQVNILGRYLYLESLLATDPAARERISLDVAISQDTQKRYLAHSEYMLHTGLPHLVSHVQHTAQRVLSSYPLQRLCTFEDVLAIVDAIRLQVEQPLNPDSNETVLNTFLLPSEAAETTLRTAHSAPEAVDTNGLGKRSRRDHKLVLLLNETRDVLESAEFNQTLSRCLNLCFYTVTQRLHSSCFLLPSGGSDASSATAKNLALPPSEAMASGPATPMAKLMPLINKQVSQLLGQEPSPLLDAMSHDGQLRQYAFDLFTAFGQEGL